MIEHDVVGRRVRLLMADERMTQRDLARAAGVSVAAINKVCQGSNELTLRTLAYLEIATEDVTAAMNDIFAGGVVE